MMGSDAPQIPNIAHFIWLGRTFPWIYGMALYSAAVRGGFDRVILHHRDDIGDTPGWRAAHAHERVQARRLNPEQVLGQTGPRGGELCELYRRLNQPAAQTNMIRAAILATEGGVYLDTDTVTVRPFAPLRSAGVFCGEERIALPGTVRRSRNPAVWAGTGARLAVREFMRRLPGGWRHFRFVEPWYHLAVNNAVLGARAGHPFVADMLDRMLALAPAQQTVRYALGTVLLQDTVAAWRKSHADHAVATAGSLVVHAPVRFYPLAAEISEHWFRTQQSVDLDQAVTPATTVVHWYASVRTKAFVPLFGPDYVRRHRDRQLLSALLSEFL